MASSSSLCRGNHGLPSSPVSSWKTPENKSALVRIQPFNGMKMVDEVMALGKVQDTNLCFVSLYTVSVRGRVARSRGGGALSSKCELSSEAAQLVSSFVGLSVSAIILTAALIWLQNAVQEIADQ